MWSVHRRPPQDTLGDQKCKKPAPASPSIATPVSCTSQGKYFCKDDDNTEGPKCVAACEGKCGQYTADGQDDSENKVCKKPAPASPSIATPVSCTSQSKYFCKDDDNTEGPKCVAACEGKCGQYTADGEDDSENKVCKKPAPAPPSTPTLDSCQSENKIYCDDDVNPPKCVETCKNTCGVYTVNGKNNENSALCRKPSPASCVEMWYCASPKSCVNSCSTECSGKPNENDDTNSCESVSDKNNNDDGNAAGTKDEDKFKKVGSCPQFTSCEECISSTECKWSNGFLFLAASGCTALQDGESQQLECSSSSTGIDMSDRQQQLYVFMFVVLVVFCVCYSRCKRTGPIIADGRAGGKSGDFTPLPKKDRDDNSLIGNDGAFDDGDDLEEGWGHGMMMTMTMKKIVAQYN